MAAETKSAGSQDATTIEQWDHDHVIHPQYAPGESDRPRRHGRGPRLAARRLPRTRVPRCDRRPVASAGGTRTP